MRHMATVVAMVIIGSEPALGRDIYVNHQRGDDAATGRSDGPLRTIAHAIKLAQAGDAIHLAPTGKPYRQSASFHNKSGEPGRPITLDGHGATLWGAEPLKPDEWQRVAPGLHRSTTVVRSHSSIIGRYYFLFDGKMVRMGRTSKGPKKPFKKPEALGTGEWTWVKEEEAFYLRIDPSRVLADGRIEAPVRANGVGISGHCEHLVIRNVIATHVWNDGYNIHGKTRDILFQNVQAIECGDDGLSAHDDCEVRVEGLLSIGNSTGICNVGHSTSANDRVYIEGCHGVDFYMLGTNTHVLRNSVIVCNAAQSVVVVGRGEKGGPGTCTVTLGNVLIKGTRAAQVIKAQGGSVVEASRVTVCGLGLSAAGKAFSLRHSVIAGDPKPAIVVDGKTKWSAERNVYDLTDLRVGPTLHKMPGFQRYKAATGQDTGSTWTSVQFVEPFDGRVRAPRIDEGCGVDPSRLPPAGGATTKGHQQ